LEGREESADGLKRLNLHYLFALASILMATLEQAPEKSLTASLAAEQLGQLFRLFVLKARGQPCRKFKGFLRSQLEKQNSSVYCKRFIASIIEFLLQGILNFPETVTIIDSLLQVVQVPV